VKVAPDIKFDVEMCRMVKRLAPYGFLWADANGGYDEAGALDAAPKLAEAGVAVLEQPVRPNRLTALQKLKKQGALPIILDDGPQFLAGTSILKKPLIPVEGHLGVPNGHGLGVEVDEIKLRELASPHS